MLVVLRAPAMTHTTRANHVKASALGEFTSKRTRGEARHSAACDWSRPVMDPAECQAHPESAGALAVGARWEQFTPRIGASWTQTWQAAALRGLRVGGKSKFSPVALQIGPTSPKEHL